VHAAGDLQARTLAAAAGFVSRIPGAVRVPYAAFGAVVVQVLRALWSGAPGSSCILPHALVARDR